MWNDYVDPEEDAHTLARANRIKGDPKRVVKAEKAAASMVTKKEEEAAAMRQVAGKSAPKSGGVRETRGLANFAKELEQENG